jgi:hypothetical protein
MSQKILWHLLKMIRTEKTPRYIVPIDKLANNLEDANH